MNTGSWERNARRQNGLRWHPAENTLKDLGVVFSVPTTVSSVEATDGGGW